MRLPSNQPIGLPQARVLTVVGAMRQSIGPAISVRLAGVAEWPSSLISAVAASVATHGWQIAIAFATCGPRLLVRFAGLDFDELMIPPDDADARRELLLLAPSMPEMKQWVTAAKAEPEEIEELDMEF